LALRKLMANGSNGSIRWLEWLHRKQANYRKIINTRICIPGVEYRKFEGRAVLNDTIKICSCDVDTCTGGCFPESHLDPHSSHVTKPIPQV
jgi:hypothetical protein